MMENGPVPDFEVYSYTDVRIRWSAVKGSIDIKAPQGSSMVIQCQPVTAIQSESDLIAIGMEFATSVPASHASLWRHLLDCFKQCWEIAERTPDSNFPMVLRSTMGPSNNSASSLPKENVCPSTKAFSVHMSEISSIAPSSTVSRQPSSRAFVAHMNDISSIAHSSTNGRSVLGPLKAKPLESRNNVGKLSPMDTRSCIIPMDSRSVAPMDSRSCVGQLSRTTTYSDSMKGVSSSSLPTLANSSVSTANYNNLINNNHNNSSSNHNTNNNDNATTATRTSSSSSTRFLPEVGWCLQTPTTTPDSPQQCSEFLLLFLDGVKLIIESPGNKDARASNMCYLRYHDCRRQADAPPERRYPIDKRLPAEVKQKLAFFPRFIGSS